MNKVLKDNPDMIIFVIDSKQIKEDFCSGKIILSELRKLEFGNISVL